MKTFKDALAAVIIICFFCGLFYIVGMRSAQVFGGSPVWWAVKICFGAVVVISALLWAVERVTG